MSSPSIRNIRVDTLAKLSISLRLREVVQILVREVLNWQVKPLEKLGVFRIPVVSKAYLPSLCTFVPSFLLFDLVLSTAADITGCAHQTTGSATEY